MISKHDIKLCNCSRCNEWQQHYLVELSTIERLCQELKKKLVAMDLSQDKGFEWSIEERVLRIIDEVFGVEGEK